MTNQPHRVQFLDGHSLAITITTPRDVALRHGRNLPRQAVTREPHGARRSPRI
jgi:hypothetical protein